MFCSKCGTQLPGNATICSACSAPLASPQSATSVGDQIGAAARDALQAVKLLTADPVGGLLVAFERLGPTRALRVGIAFGLAFALCVVIGTYRILPRWGGPHGFGGFIRVLLAALVPFASLTAANAAARRIFRGEGWFGHDCFVAGASLLPFGCVALLIGFLGVGNFEVIAILGLFAFCLTILMLFAGLTRVSKASERSATLAVPLMLIASAWLSKIIYTALL